jgi:hypothetical protein
MTTRQLDEPITILGLSKRRNQILVRAGFLKVRDLYDQSAYLEQHKAWAKLLEAVKAALRDRGLPDSFGEFRSALEVRERLLFGAGRCRGLGEGLSVGRLKGIEQGLATGSRRRFHIRIPRYAADGGMDEFLNDILHASAQGTSCVHLECTLEDLDVPGPSRPCVIGFDTKSHAGAIANARAACHHKAYVPDGEVVIEFETHLQWHGYSYPGRASFEFIRGGCTFVFDPRFKVKI